MLNTSIFIVAATVTLGLTTSVLGAEPIAKTSPPVAAGKITDITGNDSETLVNVRRAGELKSSGIGTTLYLGDVVYTPEGTMASLQLNEDTKIVLGPKSEFEITNVAGTDKSNRTILKVSVGLIRLLVKHIYSGEQTFQVSAGNAVMGVRGTNFIIDQDGKSDTSLFTLEGKVAMATNATGLADAKAVTLVEAGFTSSLTGSMTEPSTPKPFKREELQTQLDKRAPGFGKTILDTFLKADGEGARGVDYGIKKPKAAPAKTGH